MHPMHPNFRCKLAVIHSRQTIYLRHVSSYIPTHSCDLLGPDSPSNHLIFYAHVTSAIQQHYDYNFTATLNHFLINPTVHAVPKHVYTIISAKQNHCQQFLASHFYDV